MSTTPIQSSISVTPMIAHAMSDRNPLSSRPRMADRSSMHTHSTSLHSTTSSAFAPFVDLEASPYPSSQSSESAKFSTPNPVADLIPDDLYQVLRANDLINEKGVRDYIIRRAFKAMREQQELKSSEALERLQAIYPYLQIDTIRKIIYRIGPGANRKMML